MSQKNEILPLALALVATAAFLGIAYSFFQRVKPCPEGQQRQAGECVEQSQIPSPDQITSPNTSSTPITDFLSSGERVLFKGKANQDRNIGIKAFEAEKL